ncbi:hypothetical protein [Pelotomaculum propionicicum]|uniref:Uncharacterized protein n=1 Tax=Pelotomaculum propionicicum TaxID=258475 RepID=A0A4Y7RWX3_9FIRM|nr:hypothetical protein [Pelotomaculum propionicicum]TEB13353.1 hypothetical protein Pmgp_00247 [Pelotomaculum propionicicum]
MAFEEALPEWNNAGTEPLQAKKDAGWEATEKPPADWFNWLFNRNYKCLSEIRQNASDTEGRISIHDRELANIEAVLDIDNRAISGNSKFYDLLDGTNTYSTGKIDMTRTFALNPINANQTSTVVDDITGFAAGQEVTVFDDVNSEEIIVTAVNAGTKALTHTATTQSYKAHANICRSSVEILGKRMRFDGWRTGGVGTGLLEYISGLEITHDIRSAAISPDKKFIVFGVRTDYNDSTALGFFRTYEFDHITGQIGAKVWEDSCGANVFPIITGIQFTNNGNFIVVRSTLINGGSPRVTTLAFDKVTGRVGTTAISVLANQTYALLNNANTYLIAVSSTTLNVFPFNAETGVIGAVFATKTVLRLYGSPIITANDNFIIAPVDGSPYIAVYPITNGVVGDKLADPATLPPAAPYNVMLSPSNNFLGLVPAASPYVMVYNFNPVTGAIGTKLNNPPTLPASYCNAVGFVSDNCIWAFCNMTPFVYTYLLTTSAIGDAINQTLIESPGAALSLGFVSDNYILGIGTTSLLGVKLYKMRTEEVIPLLTGVARYNITPAGTTDETVAWVEHEKDAGFAVDGALSIVDTAANESYAAMTKTSTDLSASVTEDQFIGDVVTAEEKVTLKLTLSRTLTSVDKAITKILGRVG